MDVKAVSHVMLPTVNENTVGSSSASSVSTSVRLSAQASRFIEAVAADTSIAPVERRALVEAASVIEQVSTSSDMRQTLYRDLAGMGIFLRETSTENYPRWSVLTGLRYFSGRSYPLPGTSETVFSGNGLEAVEQQLEQMASEFRQATPQKVKQVLAQRPVEVVEKDIAQMLGHAVQVTSDGVDVPDVTAPSLDTTA